jgi:hypothetical protein
MRIKIGACEVNVPDYMIDTPEHKNQFFIFLREITTAQKNETKKEIYAKLRREHEDFERITKHDPFGFLRALGRKIG